MLLKEGRERTVARMLAMGYTYKEIAQQLFIAVGTVRQTLDNIKKRNNYRNRMQIVVEYTKAYKDV